jgi:hypothetical protein
MPRIPESLHALLANLIDYAGLYPPAALELPEVLQNYEAYLASPVNWILNRLVLPAAKLPEVRLRDNWRLTLLVEGEHGSLPAADRDARNQAAAAPFAPHLLRGAHGRRCRTAPSRRCAPAA